MFNVVLVEPEIPPNTGNIIRLCANTGCQLHLVEPLGFPIDHAKMRRAGLDYHEFVSIKIHKNWQAFLESEHPDPVKMYAMTTHGSSSFYTHATFTPGDWFIFGAETHGLAESIHRFFLEGHRLRLPMMPENRSLNLSNSVAITVYEAWRQNAFKGGI
jgi:tRNA (cytidine/uridine-2'-O-)-methyltransferase